MSASIGSNKSNRKRARTSKRSRAIESRRKNKRTTCRGSRAKTSITRKPPKRPGKQWQRCWGTPEAGLLDRAVAEAFALQSERKITEAIEKWRSIANIAEGTDNDQAARAWFSVGYLIHDGSADGDTGKAVDAYDRAIALKPDLAEAYASRGQAKRALGRQEDAIFSADTRRPSPTMMRRSA